MKTVTRDLTKGNLWKEIIAFALPLMFSNVLQVLFNLSDIAVVGRFGSDTALGSVGSTSTLVSLFTGILIGLGAGVNVLVARQFGARNDEDIRQLVHTAALICLLGGFLVMGAAQALVRPLLLLLGTKEELMPGALLYMRIYLCGMPALGIYNFGNGVLSAVGDSQRPLRYLTIAGVLNVALNIFFVVVCGMDVEGVAIASIAAQYLSAILITATLVRAKASFGLDLRRLHMYLPKVKSILRIGIPAGLQHSIFCIANLFVQSGINSFSASEVAGNAAAVNCENICYQLMAGIYTACASCIGQNFGAGKKDRIKKSYWICNTYAVSVSVIFALLYNFCGPTILRIFTTDPKVIEAGMVRIVVMISTYWLAAFMDNTTAACRGLGKTLLPTIFVVTGSCVFRVIWIYTVFAGFHTLYVLYLVYPISWVLTGSAVMIYFAKLYKTQIQKYHMV